MSKLTNTSPIATNALPTLTTTTTATSSTGVAMHNNNSAVVSAPSDGATRRCLPSDIVHLSNTTTTGPSAAEVASSTYAAGMPISYTFSSPSSSSSSSSSSHSSSALKINHSLTAYASDFDPQVLIETFKSSNSFYGFNPNLIGIISDYANTTAIIIGLQKQEMIFSSRIQELAKSNTLDARNELAKIFAQVGDVRRQIADESHTGKLQQYTSAALFYTYAINLISNKDAKTIQQLWDNLGVIERLIIATTTNTQLEKVTETDLQKVIEHKQELKILRDNTVQDLSNGVAAQAIFRHTTHTIKLLLAKLFQESQVLLGAPPCKYSVIGLGSMSMNQMTPYSDLEFAIITEKSRDEPRIKEYFQNLTHLVHFKTIALGETLITELPYSAVNHLMHRGITFDLGGKTPLGIRGKDYTLIGTISELMTYVQDKGGVIEKLDNILPYILEQVVHIYEHGDLNLTLGYISLVRHFLVNEGIGTKRAIKILLEGATEEIINDGIKSISHREGDLENFELADHDRAGKLFDVKREIYRLPDRLIYNFGMLYGIDGQDAWDIISKLQAKGYINSTAAANLEYITTFATTLRLKTYLYYQAKQDDLSVFATPLDQQLETIFRLPKDDLREDGSLFRYFYIALPFQKKLADFCHQYQEFDDITKAKFFKEDTLYIDSPRSKGLIYYRLLQYKEAAINLEQVQDDSDNKVHRTLGEIYSIFGEYDKAAKEFDMMLQSINKTTSDKSQQVNNAFIKQNIANVYITMGEYQKALNILQECAKVFEQHWGGQNHKIIASSVCNIAKCHFGLKNLDKANEGFKMSIGMLNALEKYPLDVSDCNDMLGMIAYQRKDYKSSIKYYEESLKILKAFYKNQPHLEIAVTLGNLAGSYRMDNNYQKAKECGIEGLKIKEYIYGFSSNRSVALSIISVGNAHAIDEPQFAFDHYIKAISMLRQLPKCDANEQYLCLVADALFNLGNQYACKRNYGEAIKCYVPSLQIKQTPSILKNLGNCYAVQGKYNEAISYYQQILVIQPLDVFALKLIGNCYAIQEKYNEAISCYQQGLKLKPDDLVIKQRLEECYENKNKLEIKIFVQNQLKQVLDSSIAIDLIDKYI